MRRGARPKPSNLRLLEGNRSNRPVPEDLPVTLLLQDTMAPEHLSSEAQEIWSWILPMLCEIGVASNMDLIALEMLCEAYAEFCRCSSQLAGLSREDRTYTSETQGGGVTIKAHPYIKMRRDSSIEVLRWLNEFGMTPTARVRVARALHDLTRPAADEEDESERYFA